MIALTVTLNQSPIAQSPVGSGLIVGQVVDAASGKPMSNAIVTIGGSSLPVIRTVTATGFESRSGQRILTGSDGRFFFRDLPRGSFGIQANKAGYSEGAYGRRRPLGPSQQLTLANGERTGGIVILMWKQAVISGRVVDEAGESLVAVRVRALRRQGLPDPRRLTMTSTTTDDRGVYRLALLDAGDYVVGVVPGTLASR